MYGNMSPPVAAPQTFAKMITARTTDLHRRLLLIGWLAVIVIAALLRLWQIGLQVLIDDEWHALHAIQQLEFAQVFTSFGHADYSIPLTLLLKWLGGHFGLTETMMLVLPLTFGVAGVVIAPWLTRHWLRPLEGWLFAALVAISPLLIHFSRQARPYALAIPLSFAALMCLWHWRRQAHAGWAIAFVPCAVAAAWLHPLSLLITGSALIWIFGLTAIDAWRNRPVSSWLQQLKLLLAVGVLTAAGCAALLLPPIWSDFASLADKAGMHRIRLHTLASGWHLLVGTGLTPVALGLAGLTLLGVVVMTRREPELSACLGFVFFVTAIGLWLLSAAYIFHGLVLVRYGTGLILVVLMLAAVGLAAVLERVSKPLPERLRGPGAVMLGGIALVGLWYAGPLPTTYQGINQFTGHMLYQFDYRHQRNPYRRLLELEVPAFYQGIAAEPGDWELIEAPWYFEDTLNVLPVWQQVHQRPLRIGMITGLCAPWTHGEWAPDDEQLRLRRFIHLSEPLTAADRGRFVIFQLQHPFDYARRLHDTRRCVASLEDRYGPAWYEDDNHIVFRLPPAGQVD